MGGPDSQYPVENSTATAHSYEYRKEYSSKGCAHEGRKASLLFISTHITHTRLIECDARVMFFYESISF